MSDKTDPAVTATVEMDFAICGRLVGQCTGWEQVDICTVDAYDLVAAKGYSGLVGDCVSFDTDRGLITTLDDDGEAVESTDLVEAIRGCEVRR